MKKIYYFYKITNLVNDHFYYGVHITTNINDGYMGSGKRLHHAYKKYGIENFKKEIIKFFENADDLYEYESIVVNNELVKNPNCYNICHGGKKSTLGIVICKDVDGNRFEVPIDDERYIKQEIIPFNKKYIYYGNKLTGEICKKTYDQEYLDSYLNNPNYQIFPFGHDIHYIRVYDEIGNIIFVNRQDENVKNGIYKRVPTLLKHSEQTKNKLRQIYKKNGHQKGERNSQFGTKWINNGIQNKKIKKDELNTYIENGWVSGKIKKIKKEYITVYDMKGTPIKIDKEKVNLYKKNGYKLTNRSGKNNPCYGKICINNGTQNKKVKREDLAEWIKNGWKKGRILNMKWMHDTKSGHSKMVKLNLIQNYLDNGWEFGRV